VMDRLDMLPLTTIGVVHGVCFGGGFELALTCDILVAEKTARFAFPELRLGIVPGFGGIPRLRRDVSNAVVRDLLLTGRSINAKKAQQAGFVSQVVPTGEGLRVARSTARQATKFDREAAMTCKRFMKPLPREELAQEREHFIRLATRPVLKLALKKFVESDDVRPYLP
jgi:enoyl-CoA hydratase